MKRMPTPGSLQATEGTVTGVFMAGLLYRNVHIRKKASNLAHRPHPLTGLFFILLAGPYGIHVRSFRSKTHIMSQTIRGRVLIIAMTDFHSQSEGRGSTLERRKGVKRDTTRLFKVLSHLGYKVSFHWDISAKEIRDVYKKESELPQGECFISILSSHGKEGIIYDFYGEPVHLRDLYNFLSPENCPALAGIPKLFFIQACRGMEMDEGVLLETDSATCDADTFSHSWDLPNDTVVIFATSEGYVAFQNPAGSVFLQTLCDIIESEEQDLSLSQIFTSISYRVAYNFQSHGMYEGYKEMPCYISNLTQELRPFRKMENAF